MKFQPDTSNGISITGYGPGWVTINQEQVSQPCIVSYTGLHQPWDCTGFDTLSAAHFETLLSLDPELIVFGSGPKIRFPHPSWLQKLYAQRIGVETMDTHAACRTFNFLAGEGRRVVAALLV